MRHYNGGSTATKTAAQSQKTGTGRYRAKGKVETQAKAGRERNFQRRLSRPAQWEVRMKRPVGRITESNCWTESRVKLSRRSPGVVQATAAVVASWVNQKRNEMPA